MRIRRENENTAVLQIERQLSRGNTWNIRPSKIRKNFFQIMDQIQDSIDEIKAVNGAQSTWNEDIALTFENLVLLKGKFIQAWLNPQHYNGSLTVANDMTMVRWGRKLECAGGGTLTNELKRKWNANRHTMYWNWYDQRRKALAENRFFNSVVVRRLMQRELIASQRSFHNQDAAVRSEASGRWFN